MAKNYIKAKDLIKDPVKAAETANLIYVTENKLTIDRIRKGRHFYYAQFGKKISDKKSIQRFKSLVIPPAWDDVKITHLKNGHLQVIGRDSKSRKQYRYHPRWSSIRNKTKFFKMAAFGNILPEMRAEIEKDLKLPKMTKRKCLALVLKLMEETHIRIGNDYYAKKNKTYGLSTLRTKHVDIIKNKIQFNFIGKKGKEHSVTLKNKRLQKLVMKCEEIPGWELFQYYDEANDHHSIDSGMVNDYIHEISGDLFSAKDFRTWSASKIFFETLYEIGLTDEKSQQIKNINIAYDAAAKGLGNTRTVCKKYYVHPIIVEKYQDGTITEYFSFLDKSQKTIKHLSNSEVVLLKMLAEYKIIL